VKDKVRLGGMKNYKNAAFYIAVTGGFSALIYWIIKEGKFLELNKAIVSTASENGSWNDFVASMLHNLQDPLAILLAQIVTIIIVARFFGWVFKKIGQPTVIGEIIAGIVSVSYTHLTLPTID
jgi:hypothetical protein